MTDDGRDLIYGWDDHDIGGIRRVGLDVEPGDLHAAERLRDDLRALGVPSGAVPPPLDWRRLTEPEPRGIRWGTLAAAAGIVIGLATTVWWSSVDHRPVGIEAGTVARNHAPSIEPPAPATDITRTGRIVTTVRFRVEAPAARHVAVAGDFNGWKPETLPMTGTDGRWQAQAALPPGRYAYMYVVDGRWITPPDARRTQDDGFGARNAVLDLIGPPEA